MARDRERSGGVEAVYEGDEVLSALLAAAGSSASAGEVAERFREAQARGEPRAAVIPRLFEGEPRFASPEDARRLYSNLFGLWERARAGATPGVAKPGQAPAPEEQPELPPRGAEAGPEVPSAIVGAVWRHLDALPARERRRYRDRYEALQPDLAAWVEARALSDVGSVAAQDLVFEIWAMFDQAFGERVGTIRFAELQAREADPPPLVSIQPAIAAYVDEVLELVADEEPGFSAAARAQVERAIAIAVAALGRERD